MVTITVNGSPVQAPAGALLASVLMNQGLATFRASPTGSPRGPLCGMGICQECRATVNGVAQTRTCTIPVSEGLTVALDFT